MARSREEIQEAQKQKTYYTLQEEYRLAVARVNALRQILHEQGILVD